MENYTDSRAIRPMILGLASAIPVVGGVVAGADASLTARYQRQQQDQLEHLIDYLESGLDDFGGPIAIQRSNPVIHAAYATITASLRTSRREKIRAFARLLQAGLEDPPRLDLETEHEDYLKILDDLSVRELQVLWLLDRFEKQNPRNDDDDDYAWSKSYWEGFENAVVMQASMPGDELSGLLVRLSRTGMYEPIYASGFGGPITATGKLTGAYKRLAALLGNDPDLFDTGAIVP